VRDRLVSMELEPVDISKLAFTLPALDRDYMQRNFIAKLSSIFCVLATAISLAAEQDSVRFTMATTAEAVAEITASAPGASWETTGAEASVADISVDGQYNQNLVLYRGAQSSVFKVFLGPLAAGAHTIRVQRNAEWSAPNASLNVESVKASSAGAGAAEYAALVHAPILYARADTIGHFSDVPMLMWYETSPSDGGTNLQYSFIFSNEDGGTATDALMARWGRTTDIEYVYRVQLDASGNITHETFQGPDHQELPFHGKKLGQHPFLLNVSRNNNVIDIGYSAMQYRIYPVQADLSQHSREELMDRFPWTYKIMAQELEREGKLRQFGTVAGTNVSDPRNYLYLELGGDVPATAGLAVWVKLTNRAELYSSDRGRLDYSIMRGGWARTTVELPPGTTADQVEYVAVQCVDLRDPRLPMQGPEPVAHLHAGGKAFLLNRDYQPGPALLAFTDVPQLRPERMVLVKPAKASPQTAP